MGEETTLGNVETECILVVSFRSFVRGVSGSGSLSSVSVALVPEG